MSKVFNLIIEMLDSYSILYKHIEHVETLTSQDSADQRGKKLEVGGKALLLKIDEEFKLFVMRACDSLHSKSIKKYFKAKKVRFATSDELYELTNLVSGSVPPFGRPILLFKLYVHPLVFTNSIILSIEDYKKIANYEELNFTK